MDTTTLSGLEFMQALVAGEIAPPSMATAIPFRPVAATAGYMKFIARADARHSNPFGTVHGGFAATVLDAAGACAIHTMVEAGVGSATIDLQVRMLRPIPRDQDLIAEGRVINVSKRLGVAEMTLKDETGKIYAHATTSCMILR